MVVVGLLMALAVAAFGLGLAARQRRTVARLRADRFLPPVDRAYFLGQVRRRLATAAVLVGVGGMIAGYYASGMDAGMDAIAERSQAAREKEAKDAAAAGRPPADPEIPEADRRFAKLVGWYWIGVLGLVFVLGCLAVLEFWAARVYWMARYREMKADHEAKLQRDLAVYRQQKLNDRMKGKRKADDGNADETGEHPAV